jgi:hypothetical protein
MAEVVEALVKSFSMILLSDAIAQTAAVVLEFLSLFLESPTNPTLADTLTTTSAKLLHPLHNSSTVKSHLTHKY